MIGRYYPVELVRERRRDPLDPFQMYSEIGKRLSQNR